MTIIYDTAPKPRVSGKSGDGGRFVKNTKFEPWDFFRDSNQGEFVCSDKVLSCETIRLWK